MKHNSNLYKLALFYYRHTSVRRKKKKKEKTTFLQVKYFPDLFLNSNTPLFHCHLGLFVSCQNANIFIALPFQSHSFTLPSSRASAQHLLTRNLDLLFCFWNKEFLTQLPEQQCPSTAVSVSLCCCASVSHANTILSPLFKILIPRSWMRKSQAAGPGRIC